MSISDPTPPPSSREPAVANDGHVGDATAPNGGSRPDPEATRTDRLARSGRLRGRVEALRERLSRSAARGSGGLLALSLVIGAGAGLGAVAFRYMILGFTSSAGATTAPNPLAGASSASFP